MYYFWDIQYIKYKHLKMKKLIISLVVMIIALQMAMSQNTVGLLSYKPFSSYDGYNLIYPHNQPDIFLLDACGEIVHTWEGDDDLRPGNTAYLLEDGNILYTSRPSTFTNDAIWAGGGGQNITLKDWDNNILWDFSLNNENFRLHHDIAPIVRNGELTVLAIAWEKKTLEEVIAVGRDTTVLDREELWPDYILEIDPATDEIVWEWHTWDHLVQDFDATKPNFGVISENPNRIDINYDFDGSGNADWMHTNSIDYNLERSQILLSVPNFSEIWIIDHTTTTEQAASSTGGVGGRGGDLMYRWGNPSAYASGTADDQKLFYQHDAHFIDEHISPVDPQFNKIGVFNNRVGDDFSTINILNPQWDMYTWGYPFSNDNYLPTEFDLTRTHPVDSTLMHSTGLSSLQYLPNTNLLVCVGRFGYSYEMTQDGDIVWEYKTPLIAGLQATQGDELLINNNLTFRMDRYPVDYPAFDDKFLDPMGWIELEPDTELCQSILPTDDININYNLEIFPNPADQMIGVKWDESMYINIEIYDIIGRLKYQELNVNGGMKYIDTSRLIDGTYTLMVNGADSGRFIVKH